MAILTGGMHTGEFILTEARGNRSRENVVVVSGQDLVAGTVLGRTNAASAIAVADTSNTGNGTMGAITLAAGVMEGVYRLTILEPGANVGDFEVVGPTGVSVGTGVVASAFAAGGLSFTLADGATDFAGGDAFSIFVRSGTVTPGSNTGNGTFVLYATGEGAQVGSYAVTITVAAANAGTFSVTAPDGTSLGTGTVAVRFTNGGLDFLINDGATDFIVGDTWTIACARDKVKAWDPDNTDGSGTEAYGILLSAVDATDGDLRGVALVRDCEVSGRLLSYASGLTAGEKETAKARLRARGILVR